MIKSLITEGKKYYFVSPHLDDAILSAGGLMSYMSARVPIQVVTIFTRPSLPLETYYAKRYVKACGFADSHQLFYQRKKEDREAFSRLDIHPIYLDYPDACWRKKNTDNRGLLKYLIPELAHIYPTRRQARTGKINPSDFKMMDTLRKELKSLIPNENSVVFCPMGIGNHVDHLITNAICSELFDHVYYWRDYPYTLKDTLRLKEHVSFTWDKNMKIKRELISTYKTQLYPLFKGPHFTLVPEVYYQRSG